MADLERFRKAQRQDFNTALKEMQNGRKRTHWIWYIFPQIAGLGMSSTAQYYSIEDLDEAKAFLNDDYLGNNLMTITETLLNIPCDDPNVVMGYPDDLKLRSCMTLFNIACDGKTDVFQKVLNKYYDGIEDLKTIELLKY